MKNKIKAHWEKYRGVYLGVGAVLVSVVAVVALAKSDLPDYDEPEDHRSDFDELKELYRLGGEKSPIVVELTESEAEAYNRVADDIDNGGIEELEPGKLVLSLTTADEADMDAYNKVADLTNEYIAASEEGHIPHDQFDPERTHLERV